MLSCFSRVRLCNSKDSSLPGSSVHGLLQAKILESIAVPFSRGFSQPRDWTQVPRIACRFFTSWVTRETPFSQSESCSVMSNSWYSMDYSPWNSLGKNTGVNSRSLLHGILPTQGSNQASHIAGRFFTSWTTRMPKSPYFEPSLKVEFNLKQKPIQQWLDAHCYVMRALK